MCMMYGRYCHIIWCTSVHITNITNNIDIIYVYRVYGVYILHPKETINTNAPHVTALFKRFYHWGVFFFSCPFQWTQWNNEKRRKKKTNKQNRKNRIWIEYMLLWLILQSVILVRCIHNFEVVHELIRVLGACV